MSPEVSFEPPESDKSVIEMFKEGLYEVPIAVHKGCPVPETSSTQSLRDEIFANLLNFKSPYDLISPEKRQQLDRALGESDRVYRKGLSDTEELTIG